MRSWCEASMELRSRDYEGEEAAHSLPRVPTDDHPLITRPSSSHHQTDTADSGETGFYDPLRGPTANPEDHSPDVDVNGFSTVASVPSEEDPQASNKEWVSYKRSLMQKFSVSKIVSVSSTSDIIIKSGKAYDHSSTSLHLEELDNPQKVSEDGAKVITQQEYALRLRELKVEIGHAWKTDDRVTSLKLSIKVAKLLMDTSVSEFYPTLFILVTDVMDMLGEMVWERIKRKAEYANDGSIICSLHEDFSTNDINSDAKETCFNWFCKIASIRELLPRIYLELAILQCWRFLQEQPWGSLHRLVSMIRGLTDPLASFYCRLYMVHCAQKLLPHDTGYLLTCIDDIKIILTSIILGKETIPKNSLDNKKLLNSLLEPTIEWIMKCICKEAYKKRGFEDIIAKLQLGGEVSQSSGPSQCISIILHHFLKELPTEVVCSHSLYIVQLIECTNDVTMKQYLNYRLLGLKLSEQKSEMDCVVSVLGKVFQVITKYNNLGEYLEVVDAFLDIVLQYSMDNYLTTILDGIQVRADSNGVTESELSCLQSILMKLLAYFSNLEDVFALNHFVEILHVMYGSSRDIVNMNILNKAIRNGYIRDPTTIQQLFEISQVLHGRIDILDIKDDYHKQQRHLICRFVQMVDFGAALDSHLTFLIECRSAFRRIGEVKEVLVHSSNSLAIKSIKRANKHLNFVKSCIAFSEVTIPSVSAATKRMNLYLETVEVALLGGLLSHSDGLIDSAIGCVQSLDQYEGSQLQNELDGILPLIQKLFSLLVIIPGNSERGVAYVPRCILSVVESCPWTTPQQRLRVFCAIFSLSSSLSQNKLPYNAYHSEVMGNDLLYFGDPTYYQELASLSNYVLSKVIDGVLQEQHLGTRGNMALETCNCILTSFKASSDISQVCFKLIEIAKSCLKANDNHMRATLCYLHKSVSNISGSGDTLAPVPSVYI